MRAASWNGENRRRLGRFSQERSWLTCVLCPHFTFSICFFTVWSWPCVLISYGERVKEQCHFTQSSRPTSFNLLILNSIHNLFFLKVIKGSRLRTFYYQFHALRIFFPYMCAYVQNILSKYNIIKFSHEG